MLASLPYPAVALLAASAWGILMWLMATLHFRLLRNPDSGAAVSQTIGVLVILTLIVGAAGIPFLSLALGTPTTSMQHVVATTLAVAIVSAVLFTTLAGKLGATMDLRGGKGRRVQSRLRTGVGSVGACVVLCTIGNWIAIATMLSMKRGGSMVALGVIFLASLGLALMQRRIVGAGSKGAALPFEDSPVYDELKAIAAYFGENGEKLRLQTTKFDSAGGREMTQEQLATVLRTWMFRLRAPTIPIELFQRVDARELTAAVAYRYSLSAPMRRGWELGKRVIALVLVLIVCTAILGVAMSFLVTWLNAGNPGGRTRFGWIPGVVIGAIIGGGMRFVITWLGVVRSSVRRWTDAHAAWREALPRETREFPDFVAAILASDRIILALDPDTDMIVLLSKNSALLKAAKKGYGMEKWEFLEAVRGRMAQPLPSDAATV